MNTNPSTICHPGFPATFFFNNSTTKSDVTNFPSS
jgi:hypothetical protein